jgi:hypothetical protein
MATAARIHWNEQLAVWCEVVVEKTPESIIAVRQMPEVPS